MMRGLKQRSAKVSEETVLFPAGTPAMQELDTTYTIVVQGINFMGVRTAAVSLPVPGRSQLRTPANVLAAGSTYALALMATMHDERRPHRGV